MRNIINTENIFLLLLGLKFKWEDNIKLELKALGPMWISGLYAFGSG